MKYKRNFLNKVIVRIDFLNKISLLNKQIPKNISNVIQSHFPIVEPRESILSELQIKAPNIRELEPKKILDWNFYGKNRKKHLHINWENMFIVFFEYNSFVELKNYFLDITEKLFENFSNELQVKRLGLRYINSIEVSSKNPFYWGSYLNTNLLSIFKITEDKKQIARAFNNLEINFGDFLLRFQYGMYNPDFPAPIRKKIFILDFDAYSNILFGINEIKAALPIYHENIVEYFEKSIKDGFRRKLNE